MPLYSDPGYSYYSGSGGNMYSPYYSTPLYGSSSSSSSSPYAPYSSTYNRSMSGTYSLPSSSRSTRYTTLVSSYQPKLSTITESPLNRSNFIPLTRIKSPKISTYTSSTYIPTPRTSRLKTINTADIDVSASSRYGKHSHIDDRKEQAVKAAEVVEEKQPSNAADSDTSSGVADANSPYMPRIDGTDMGHNARSTIKRNRAVVRLSTMRSRSKDPPKDKENLKEKSESKAEPDVPVLEKKDPPERSYIQDKAMEHGIQVCVTDMAQSQIGEASLNEMIIEVDPITHAVRRLSIPQVPTFHDFCEDISSDKIDDDLNAGELRRRASLIQEQEIEIINELQKSQSGSFQVIHLERNVSQEDCRKSRKSKKIKKLRHKITANVEIINPPLTPVIQQVIEEECGTSVSPTVLPKFTFNIDEIEEHKVFKLPKKRVKSVKSKKSTEGSVKETKHSAVAKCEESYKVSEKSEIVAPEPTLTENPEEPKSEVKSSLSGELSENPKGEAMLIEKSTNQIPSDTSSVGIIEEEPFVKVAAPKPEKQKEEAVSIEQSVSQSLSGTSSVVAVPEEPLAKVATPKPIRKIQKQESSEDFWSQIGSRETLYMNKRKKTIEKSQTTADLSSKDQAVTTLESTSSENKSNEETTLVSSKSDTTLNGKNLEQHEDVTAIAPDADPLESFWPDESTSDEKYLMLSRNKMLSKVITTEEAKAGKPVVTSPKTKTPVTEKISTVQSKQEVNVEAKPKVNMETQPQSTVPPLKVNEKITSPPDTPKKVTPLAKTLTDPVLYTDQTAVATKKIVKDSPKNKNPVKISSKKKASPKNDAKEEMSPLESNTRSKAKPSASPLTAPTTNEDNNTSTKISSGTDAKSPEKNKTVKSDINEIKQSITQSASLTEVSNTKITDKDAPAAPSTKKSYQKTHKQDLQNPSTQVTKTTTLFDRKSIKLTIAKSDIKSGPGETGYTKPELCDNKLVKDLKQADSLQIKTSTPLEILVTASQTIPTATPIETQSVTLSSAQLTQKETPDVSVAQVLTTASSSQSQSQSKTTTTTTTTFTTTQSVVLGSGSNNLSKFATVSNLAQCLLDVDADLEDFIPSSADETDSSSDSYSGDGSLSASMKKKNKQLKKKAKEAQQAFDPNKKIKIDPKKKCYVKEEAPRYPLVATPRPLWKREKIVYEESSNSSSEETESESECTSSDEYEDELCPKDAIIRMSTCSNDSGFDGGTTPSSPKKVLETSYTYLQFQKTGRITAPATTIPRFKKYSVEDFNFLAVLGKGSFGKVLLAELRNTDFYYAVKCLKKDVVLEDDDVECTLIERKVLALGTKHPYLCHLFCTYQTESHLFFVMEYLNGGDLMFHIQESGRFPEDRARFYGAEIISGLKFLHKKGIIYRDLKLDNVLLDFDGHVRIADFGMCKLQIYLDKTADSFCGTPDYMAPEIIKGDKYNQNVDWWSFGVLLYEMLIGQSPFSGCDEDELFWSICNEIPWFPVYITQEATSILKGLLEKDYTRRVGSHYSPAGDICDHIFFKDIDWGLLEKRQLPPPFKPQVKHPLDTQYFDRSFTRERVRLTPIDKEILQSMDQEQFQGFSYTNPNATLD